MSHLVCLMLLLLAVVGTNRTSFAQRTETQTSESNVQGSIKLRPGVTVPGLIVFGDSIVDSGNNNNLRTLLKCNFPPYGQDFPGKVPTGRFTDGKTPSDIIAEKLGLAEAVPAYLDPKLKNEDLLKGINFASGGSGYDPLTSKVGNCISMWDQLKLFQEYKQKLIKIMGEEKTNFFVENSIYLVVASSNDIAHTYMPRSMTFNRTAYPQYLAALTSKFTGELYNLGARRIGVFSAVPIGCVPSVRTLFGGLKRGCSQKLNKMALEYNASLSNLLAKLAKEVPNNKIVYIQVYDTLYDMILNPKKYGFEVSNKGCCGIGMVAVSIMCTKINPFTCKNASSHIFWDSYHPTEQAYRIIVDNLLGTYINQLT